MIRRASTLFTLVLAASPALSAPRNLEIVLDCSGSMETVTTRFTSFQDKVAIAKQEILRYVDNLPEADTRLALRVFGTVKKAGCNDSLLLRPLIPIDKTAISQVLAPVRPAFRGKTPIAYSLKQALTDFQAIDAVGQDNSIILLTDGVESCDGNVDRAIESIRRAGIDLKVNIVGFDVLQPGDTKTAERFERMAKQTGGKAEFPKTQAELEQSLKGLDSNGEQRDEAPPEGKPSGLIATLQENVVLIALLGLILLSAGTFLTLRSRS